MEIRLSDMPKRRYSDSAVEFRSSNAYLDDLLRILNSKAYRRGSYKTQVYTTPRNPHVRTRAVHTNEVFAIATLIAEALGLDRNLVQAIAAGHDIGHVPFGHLGEDVLKKLSNEDFHHAKFGVIVAQQIERKGKGLNLTKATLLGMLSHTRGKDSLHVREDLPQECDLVMFADKIAYTFSDLNDAVRYGGFNIKNIPKYVNELGIDQRERTDTVIRALLQESQEKGRISFSFGDVFDKFKELRKWMFKNVYEKVNRPSQEQAIESVYKCFQGISELQDFDPALLIALMTDIEVLHLSHEINRSCRPIFSDLRHFGFVELLPYLEGKKINIANPDLDW